MKWKKLNVSVLSALLAAMVLVSCQDDLDLLDDDGSSESESHNDGGSNTNGAVFLLIDEESIDNGNPPNNFSETDVNDQLASLDQRSTLRYFQQNIGRQIDLFSGEVGDEGWFAIKTIPNSWIQAGPTSTGTENFLRAAPGLGGGDDDPEKYLDKIPDITPLRATGLRMLVGQRILALVYDSDISINYSPLNGSLKGETLGLVALEVLQVRKRNDGSSGSLPRITVRILNVDTIREEALKLFMNAPVPQSSSEPYDITPPNSAEAPQFADAR